jgi:hypothetical protein
MPVMKIMKVRKVAMKKKPRAKYTHFSQEEKDRLHKLQDEGKSPSRVAELLGRDLSSVNRHFQRNAAPTKKAPKPVGRPPALSEKQVDNVAATAENLIQAAAKKHKPHQVTAGMVRTALKLKCTDKVVLNALHSRDVWSHKMREKPVRTDEDDKARRRFGDDYHEKPACYWDKITYLDNKFFPVYPTGKARSYAAKRALRRTFRKKGAGLAKGHVKPRKDLKVNFGIPSVQVAVAITAKKVLMCHVVKGKWCGTAAAKMYSNSLAPALRKAYPHQRKFKVLEDNDPTGYKSKAGEVAKKNAKIEVFELPKRSPDLNPLDYGFWSAVNRRLRLQEAKFPKTKCETRKQFISRLRGVVLRIPKAVLTPMVRSMKWRCIAVKKAKGGHFEESPKKAKGCRK